MNLNIREMIAGPPTRLRYVFRYSTTRVSHPESVAEHSYYVAFYSMLVARWAVENGMRQELIQVEMLLQRALLHDMEESVSGDFPRPFKRSSIELQTMLEQASRAAFIQAIVPVTGPLEPDDEDPGTGFSVSDEYVASWCHSKDDSIIGRILEFADFLAVLSFMIQEGASTGNQLIHNHIRNMEDYFAIFKAYNYDFIRPLVGQAQLLMDEVFPKALLQIRT